jgi:hypothetical protein
VDSAQQRASRGTSSHRALDRRAIQPTRPLKGLPAHTCHSGPQDPRVPSLAAVGSRRMPLVASSPRTANAGARLPFPCCETDPRSSKPGRAPRPPFFHPSPDFALPFLAEGEGVGWLAPPPRYCTDSSGESSDSPGSTSVGVRTGRLSKPSINNHGGHHALPLDRVPAPRGHSLLLNATNRPFSKLRSAQA